MREVKIQVLWIRNKRDFTKEICEHYTTVDRLCNGEDKFPYKDVNIIAKRQFTGLQDCNGVEIYEGDLVKIVRNGTLSEEVFVRLIGFDDGRFNIGKGEILLSKSVKVIGNIHQDLELLKDAEQ